jgi:hypothetical protein
MTDKWLGNPPSSTIPRLKSLLADLELLAADKLFQPTGRLVQIEDLMIARRAVLCLAGTMNGHPHIRDGAAGITTELFYLDERRGLARSFNRWYRFAAPRLDA